MEAKDQGRANVEQRILRSLRRRREELEEMNGLIESSRFSEPVMNVKRVLCSLCNTVSHLHYVVENILKEKD